MPAIPAELWRRQVQLGREVSYGVPVAATRKAYLTDPTFTREVTAEEVRFATGTRDNVRAIVYGPVEAGGSVSMPISPDELLEWLLCGIRGSVTPTTPSGAVNARRWYFTPGTSLDSMTIEESAGDVWRIPGVYVNEFTFAGNVREALQNVTMTLFGKDKTTLGSITAALADRTPNFAQGWQTRVFLDAFGGTPQTLQKSFAVTDYSVTIGNGLDRVYTADNTQSAATVSIGELTVTAMIRVLATSALATAEFANWVAGTSRLLTLSIGNNDVIDVGTNEVQTLTEGTPMTAGTYTLTFRGQTTSALAYNATAAATQTALEALGTIGTGNVTVTGGPLDTALVTITFGGQLAGQDVPVLSSTQTSLTGTFSHATTTPGVGYRRAVNLIIPGMWTAVDLTGDTNGMRSYEFTLGYRYDSVLAAGVAIECITDRLTAF